MVKVTKIELNDVDTDNCKRGRFRTGRVSVNLGDAGVESFSIFTCKCGKGCLGSCVLPKIDQEFPRLKNFLDFIYGND